MTIEEVIRGTNIEKRANIIILDDNSALLFLDRMETTSDFNLPALFISMGENGELFIKEAICLNPETTKIHFSEGLKNEGIIVVEDKGGATIFDFKNSRKLIKDNLFSRVYSTNASLKLNEDDNFCREYSFEDSKGKFLIGLVETHFDTLDGFDNLCSYRNTCYVKMYYGLDKHKTDIEIYQTLKDVLDGNNPFVKESNVDYLSLLLENSAINPVFRFVSCMRDYNKLLNDSIKTLNSSKFRNNIYDHKMSSDSNVIEESIRLSLRS